MKRKVLASLMAIWLLFNGFAVQAAGNEACDHTNIHSFDTTTRSVETTHGHWMPDGSEKLCKVTYREYFTTYVCSDCGTIVDTIDHHTENHQF